MRACNCARASPFQSTHPRGVRLLCQVVGFDRVLVSIHAPAWGATWRRSARYRLLQSFNPRTRVGCDFLPLRSSRHTWMFQSTHPRGVRLRVVFHCEDSFGVSIHAPAWGATRERGGETGDECVSIHAPAWGATGCRGGMDRGHNWFQSTHPRGVRRAPDGVPERSGVVSIHAPAWGATTVPDRLWACVSVSIHAPAWGATSPCICRVSAACGFNPRTRVGCDPWLVQSCNGCGLFQSTHPRGVRP